MTSGSDQGWRGGKSRRGREKEEQAQPTWKKSRSSQATGGRRKSRFRLLGPVVALTMLVALTIYMYWAAQQVRTHFLVMDLLAGSADFDPAATPDLSFAATAAEYNRSAVRISQSPLNTLDLARAPEGDAAEAFKKADVIVIYLQTVFLPDADGGFRCLIRNSTPGLDFDDSQYEPLQKLSESLTAFRQQHPAKNFLLLVDIPPLANEWRLGYVRSTVFEQLRSWTESLGQLVVMVGAADTESGHTFGPGSGGTTVFGKFVGAGFSQLADADGNGLLQVSEFCDFVATHTDDWVKNNRNQAGQKVQILPDPLSLKGPENPLNFVVMKNLPAGSLSVASGTDPEFLARLEEQWKLREDLYERCAWRWNPLLWNAASDYLYKSEFAWLNGHSQNAEQSLTRGTELLKALVRNCDERCGPPESLNKERGLPRKWFEGFPAFSRLNSLWNESEAVQSQELPRDTLQEQVLLRQLQAFPWEQIGLTPPAGDELSRAENRRRDAENAVAGLFGVANRLKKTVRAAEAGLLRQEDQLFVRRESTASPGTDPAHASFEACEAFARAMQTAEMSLSKVMVAAPGLARWCANAAPFTPLELRELMAADVLAANSAAVPMTAVLRDQLLSRIESISATTETDIEAAVKLLQAEAARQFILARGLQSAMSVSEPEGGFPEAELRKHAAAIDEWNQSVSRSLENIENLSEELCKRCLDADPATRTAQLQIFGQLNAALALDHASAARRVRVVRKVVDWNRKLSEPQEESAIPGSLSAPPTENSSPVATRKAARDREVALWHLQYLNLIAPAEGPHPASAAWSAIARLAPEDSADRQHEGLAEFGLAIRTAWKNCRSSIREAMIAAGPESHEMLRTADQRSGLLPGFDAEIEFDSSRPANEKLNQLDRYEYCMLHAERLADGQWVDTGDRSPWVRNGWYAQMCDAWLKQARQSADALRTSGGTTPPFITQALNDATSRLQASEDLRFVTAPAISTVDLSDQNVSRRTTGVDIKIENSSGQQGIASLLVTSGGALTGRLPVSIENNAQPLSLTATTSPLELVVARSGNPGGDGCEHLALKTTAFFRGRTWSSEPSLKINPCAGAEFVTTRVARPASASVTVIGSDPRPIVLILDWSSSMKARLPGGKETRAQAALDTLAELIERQSLADTRVSLKVYGHRMNYNGTSKKHEPNDPPYKALFNKPIPDNLGALQDIETELPMTIMNETGRNDFNSVIEKLRKLTPWGITPLATAITQALNVDLGNNAGIVIAVTDGEAKDVGQSTDAGNQAENDGREKALIEALARKSDSKVFIVAFDLNADNPERKSLEEIFVKKCGIRVIDAADKGQLLTRIQQSLPPRKFELKLSDAASQPQPAELGSTVSDLKPGSAYSIHFDELQTPDDAPIFLSPGDHLKVNLDLRQRQFRFLRDVESQMKASASADFGDDRPSILRAAEPAKIIDTGSGGPAAMAKMEVSVMLDHRNVRRSVRQPSEIEFRVRARESDFEPANVVEKFTSQYGAPAWTLSVDAWPKQHDVLINAFWKFENTPPEITLPWSDLRNEDRPEKTRKIGGDGSGLPVVTVWTRLMETGVLQVRLDRVPGAPYAPDNAPEDVRVQIGQRDVRELNSRFRPEEVSTSIRRSESGSVIFEFDGSYNQEILESKELAFTSYAARKANSVQLSEDLVVDQTR